MPKIDPLLGKVEKFYSDAITEYGPVASGVNWKSKRDQDIRFEYLARVIADGTQPVDVADIGCGYAALYAFLKESGVPLGRYIGYDVSAAMVKSARERTAGTDGVDFIVGDRIDREVDYAFASGIFNVSLGQSESAWTDLVKTVLDNMNAMSRCGFAFNMMTDKVDWRVDDLFYANPAIWLEHCLSQYSRRVTLYHDMPFFEWTMIVRKDQEKDSMVVRRGGDDVR